MRSTAAAIAPARAAGTTPAVRARYFDRTSSAVSGLAGVPRADSTRRASVRPSRVTTSTTEV
jgi:hypothetical protein